MRVNMRRTCRGVMKVIVLVSALYFVIMVNSNALNTARWQSSASEVDLQHNGSKLINSQYIRSASPAPLQEFHNFIHALTVRADPDGYIVLAMIDEAFTDMAINFYEASLRTQHVDNFLFVGVGRKACEVLSNVSIACFYYADDPGAGRASSYGQQEFKRKMNIRTDMILEALAANFTVLHSDVDVAFLSNPVDHVKRVMNATDVSPMWDTVAYNAGFIALRPTPLAIKLYLIIRKMTQEYKSMDDQGSLNRAIKRLRNQNPAFTMRVLNRQSFLSGHAYFEQGGRMLPRPNTCDPSRRPNCPIVVHNNWIVSKSAKIYRFREHLMWLYDGDNRYYSSDTRNYITYRNSNGSAQLAALSTALAMGHLLDRVVILPTFICGGGNRTRRCPLNSLIRISRLDSSFKDRFRESSFLRHPKVPDVVKRSLYDGGAVLRRGGTTTSDVRITSRQLTKLFAKVSARVLNVGNLSGVQIIFDDKSEGEMFKQKLQQGIRRAGYRQY